MEVLKVSDRIYSINSPKHIDYDIMIDEEYRELNFFLDFYPSYLADKENSISIVKDCFMEYLGFVPDDKVNNHLPLKNLLTLSIDSPNKTLGTAHRHQKQQKITISDRLSSRGFVPSKIIKGKWKATLSVHAVVTEYVDYIIRVEAIND